MEFMTKQQILAGIALLPTIGASAVVIFQEGFETPEVSGDYVRYQPNQTVTFEEGDWTVQNVDHFEDADGTWRGEAKEGDQYIDLACSVNGFIEKTLSIDAGSYQVSFWLAGNFFAGNDADKSVDVSLDLSVDIDPATFSATKTGQEGIVSADDWIFVQSSVFSVSQTQNLTIGFDDTSADTDPWAGAYIDDVQIVVIPEPVAATLLGISSLALILRRRIFKP
jgi:hypothetical protein